jgi:hypothetical protein
MLTFLSTLAGVAQMLTLVEGVIEQVLPSGGVLTHPRHKLSHAFDAREPGKVIL